MTRTYDASGGNQNVVLGYVDTDGAFVPVKVAAPLPVTGAVTQSGTWTEANSAAMAASLSVMDDWDESDRAKVNLIAGQAGVAANVGNPSALTQRVIPASMPYALCGASATTTLGANGTTGDYLRHVTIQPTSLTLAAFQILDNAVVVHQGTATTLLDLRPIIIPVGSLSVSGAWKVLMGAGGTATAFGVFTA